MSSLYNLRSDYERVMNMMYDDDYDEQTVIDTLDSIEGAIEDKAEACAFIMQNLDADIAAIKAEENRLKKRRTALENNKKRMHENLYMSMKTVGRTEIKTPLFSFNIQKAGGVRALVLDVEPDKLPVEYQKVTIAADNEALRKLLGDSESCQFCHLAEQGEYLRIR